MFDTQEWAGEVRAALFDHDQSAADEDWVRLLHLGMKVSLTTDEGRPTRIGLVVGDRMTGAEVTHLRPPHEASPSALTKIAHATPGGGLIWLGRRESEYQIEAIQPANSSRRGLPESPVIDVVGPGHLRVLFGDRPVWYARAGESSKISGQREGLQRVVRERFADFIGEHLLPLATSTVAG